MSGHSKWSTIKHKKAATDAKRGKLFSKVIKEITVAARLGGGDIATNPRLRTAVAGAKAANMQSATLQKAIKKGTGEIAGETIEEIAYEGYGPGGVALLIQAMTDNKNRSVSDIRACLGKNGGNMGELGCVGWMFDSKGLIAIPADQIDEADLMDLVLEAGAEDISSEGDVFEIITSPADFEAVSKAIDAKGLKPTMAELTMIPQNTVKLDEKHAAAMLKLMDALDDVDDVQKVYANFDISNEIMESLLG